MSTRKRERAKRLLPARDRCAAWVPDSVYRKAGQCEKSRGLVDLQKFKLCRHHAQQLERRGVLDLGAGVRLEGAR